ncbi:uncharacterized protein LOC119102716 [Pollicipes pollicipes]|uniref:uncharacterized protein LOC119102716 n=1 Tax=Pollicipes pollicipes TaxID=41117 RepID=UPI001884C9E1|nr:uncharacterized protein LOC119102716 [Pollicipes pollicipes]
MLAAALSGSADQEQTTLDVSDASGGSPPGDDEFGLVETALSAHLRPIVTDFVKLEVEEHELEDPGDRDDLDWEVPTAGENDSSYGRPYLTTAGRSAARHNGPIEVLELPERRVRLVVVRDRLVIQNTDESDSEPTPSHNDLTFMELVKIKEAVTKKVDETSAGGPEEHIRRLRMARRQAISWVETRLRSEAQGDITPSSHGKQGKSKYDALITARPTTAAAALTPARAATVSSSRGRGRPLLPKPPMVRLTGARHVTVEGQPPTAVDADDPDYDPTAGDDFDNERARKLSAATRPTQFTQARVNIQTTLKTQKINRDLVILQAKQRDLQNVGAELRRAVDYFSVEATKDQAKIARLKNENSLLEKKLKDLETSILGNTPQHSNWAAGQGQAEAADGPRRGGTGVRRAVSRGRQGELHLPHGPRSPTALREGAGGKDARCQHGLAAGPVRAAGGRRTAAGHRPGPR